MRVLLEKLVKLQRLVIIQASWEYFKASTDMLQPALTKNQRAGRRRGERRKSRRKKKFEGRLDAYAKALNTTKEDPRVMAAIDAEDKKLSQGANRLANPPKSGSTKTKFFHDETLLANREYYQNDLAVLADPAKNQRRIDQLQEHFNAVGNWSIWSDGKAVVREDLKAEELKARRDWRNRALPEHIAAETIKKIAFGLRVVRGNMLRGLGLWSAPAAEIHNKLVEMYAAYNQT